MNGSTDGAPAPQSNGVAQSNGGSSNGAANIITALDLIYGRNTSNEERQHASEFLDKLKANDEAPYNGFMLSSNSSHSPTVRHFGLSLLEYSIRHRWDQYSEEQAKALRGWIIDLAKGLIPQDPPYIRNKVAQLWAEVAKRSWAIDWTDMDQLLVEFWQQELLRKELVLSVLETLSEDVFYREDTASSLRDNDLNRALVEIFTPVVVFQEKYPNREGTSHLQLRYGDEGWLLRISDLLDWCIQNNMQNSKEIRDIAIKALATLRSAMTWAIPKAISAAHCVASISRLLTIADMQVVMSSIEPLLALYCRPHFEVQEFRDLICPMYETDSINLLRKLYEWSVVDASHIDESKYAVSKKLSEMIGHLASFIEERPSSLRDDTDLAAFFTLMMSVAKHQSLLVSIPVLHAWVKLLGSEIIGGSETVTALVGPLLEFGSQRVLRYEALPEDSEEPAIIFLNEDIDTMPERHAFLGNYRRYATNLVELIVQRRPLDAFGYILQQTDATLQDIHANQGILDLSNYKKSSATVIKIDATFTAVEAALKGYSKWVAAHGKNPQQDEEQRNAIENHLLEWCINLLNKTFEDPMVKQRIIKLAADFSSRLLEKKQSFALSVLEHILTTQPADRPEFPVYSEAVKELHQVAAHELRRLAMRCPDYFIDYYDQLQSKIQEVLATSTMEDRPQSDLSAVLFIIVHRATKIDAEARQTRLQSFVSPVVESWQNAAFTQSLSSFKGFCELLGVDRVQEYMQSRHANKLEDWSVVSLDEEGKSMQERMNDLFQQLPLKPTKTLIGVSTDKLKKDTDIYTSARELWQPAIPLILPNLLQLLSHAHAFHNPESWTGLPVEMQSVVGRILTDRFWQAGISSGSRDDFYAKINFTKTSLEGFASSVRRNIRQVRETCYSILYGMSRMDEYFYGFEELPGPLAHALFANANHLSSHQFSVLLHMVRFIIDDCPVKYRPHFLPPILATLFTQMDQKVSAEWDMIEQRKTRTNQDDDLTEEMKDESILRQLTYNAVMMVASLLDPQRGGNTEDSKTSAQESLTKSLDPNESQSSSHAAESRPLPEPSNSMRLFVLSSPTILEPLILFCTHALRMRDTRSCIVIARVIRSVLPSFAGDEPGADSVREFMSTEVLKACITSVHEPYFVDLQKDLAQVIATIWVLYGDKTPTPKSIILSLPGITPEKADKSWAKMVRASSGRQQRAIILDLLEGLRGVSISEQGKIDRRNPRRVRSEMQQRFMKVDEAPRKDTLATDDGPDLGGVADMFS